MLLREKASYKKCLVWEWRWGDGGIRTKGRSNSRSHISGMEDGMRVRVTSEVRVSNVLQGHRSLVELKVKDVRESRIRDQVSTH